VQFRIGRAPAASDELKGLHRACFGKPGAVRTPATASLFPHLTFLSLDLRLAQKATIKKNLREFSGFVFGDKVQWPRSPAVGTRLTHPASRPTGSGAGQEEAIRAEI